MSKYIIEFFVQGNKYDKCISTGNYNYNEINKIFAKFKETELDKTYKELYSSKSGYESYYVYYSEAYKTSKCFAYELYEITDFVDINGNNITVGDIINICPSYNVDDNSRYLYRLNRSYDNTYYLRPVNKGYDINNVNQSNFDNTVIYKLKKHI